MGQHQHRLFSLQTSLLLLQGVHNLRTLAVSHEFLQGMQGGGLRQQGQQDFFESLIREISQLQAILGLSNGGSSGPCKVLSTTIINPIASTNNQIWTGIAIAMSCVSAGH